MNTLEDEVQPVATRPLDHDEMDWDAYAQHYDQMCRFNPAYEENIELLLTRIPQWDLPKKPIICDLGAGTGNYISRLHQIIPDASYYHIDIDGRMIESARRKYQAIGLSDVKIVHEKVHNVRFPSDTFDVILCVNALYAFTPQAQVLANMRAWLKPGGKLFLIDFGRRQRTLEWALYMFREAVRARMVGEYAKAFLEGKEVLKQNRRSTKGQESGRYWLHSTEEFGAVLREAGFTVEELTSCYRDYADMAVCSK